MIALEGYKIKQQREELANLKEIYENQVMLRR